MKSKGDDDQQRSARPARVVSMRFILSVATVALITVTVIGFGTLAEQHSRRALTTEVETRLVLEARNLASLSVDALLSEFPELTLCPLVKEVQTDRPDLAFVVVLDHEQRVQGHIDLAALDKKYDRLDGLRPGVDTTPLKANERILQDENLLVASVPARHANGRTVGTAVVGLHRSYLDGIIAEPRRSFLYLTAGMLAAGIATTLLLMGYLLRPIAVLRQGLERIGRGDLDTAIRLKARSELGQLAENINGMARQLKVSQAELLEKERLGHEMDLASQIQQSLLPEASLQTGEFTCLGRNQAAAEVGGDYFDYFELSDGRLGFVVADVSGKGLGGCLVTSMLAVLIRSLRDQYGSPRKLLVALEDEMAPTLAPGTFITIFYGVLDAGRGRLTYASAAHSPLFVYRAAAGQVEEFKTKGIPLGAMRGGLLGRSLVDSVLDLEPGDVVVQYTDGLNEAWNPVDKEQFGFERITETICRTAPRGLPAVLDSLAGQAAAWSEPDPPGDDLTLFALGRQPAAVPTEPEPGSRHHPAAAVRGLTDDNLGRMLAGIPHLKLPADLARLESIRPWMESDPALSDLPGEQKMMIESSLFEVCANIIEHGYGQDAELDLDLWWLPIGFAEKTLLTDLPLETAHPTPTSTGYFLICDHGTAFDPDSWSPPDLQDPAVRRKGRGLGLQIVHSSMAHVEQIPNTPAGNLTLLRFDPADQKTDREVTHV